MPCGSTQEQTAAQAQQLVAKVELMNLLDAHDLHTYADNVEQELEEDEEAAATMKAQQHMLAADSALLHPKAMYGSQDGGAGAGAGAGAGSHRG